jgi:hypothetical protein
MSAAFGFALFLSVPGLTLSGVSPSAGVQAPAAPTASTPDRSGLKDLQEVLEAMGSLKDRSFDVDRMELDRPDGQLSYEGSAQYDVKGPRKVRIQAQGMWGDGLLVVWESQNALVDGLTMGERAVLFKAPEKPQELWRQARTDSYVGAIPYLLNGMASLSFLAPDKGTVIAKTEKGTRVVETTGSTLGRIRIGWSTEKGFRLEFVERILERSPLFGASRVVEKVATWTKLRRMPKDAFAAKPEKGVDLDDQRKTTP